MSSSPFTLVQGGEEVSIGRKHFTLYNQGKNESSNLKTDGKKLIMGF